MKTELLLSLAFFSCLQLSAMSELMFELAQEAREQVRFQQEVQSQQNDAVEIRNKYGLTFVAFASSEKDMKIACLQEAVAKLSNEVVNARLANEDRRVRIEEKNKDYNHASTSFSRRSG